MTATTPLPVLVENIPASIRSDNRWLIWRYETRDGDVTKVPYMAVRPDSKASSTDPATWSAFDIALAAYRDGKGDGIGFALGDGYFGLDCDHAVAAGVIAVDGQAMLQAVPTYAELSVSGTGLHLIGRGTLPPGRRRLKNIEAYDSGRYFTVSGHRLPDAPVEVCECGEAVAAWHRRVFPTSNGDWKGRQPVKSRPVASVTGDDAKLIEQAARARNGAKFSALWAGDTSEYGGDDSAADLALCSLLAFWTGRDAARMDRLFRQSGLMREKWDAGRGDSSYGAQTIDRACANCHETYSERGRPAPDAGTVIGSCPQPGSAVGCHSRTLSLTPASSIRVRPVHWLWQGRLAIGTFDLMAGREGVGKTTCAYTIAADVTRGTLQGVYQGTPRGVIIAATEDSWEHTIVPRLMAAGADLGRVYRVDVVTSEGVGTTVSLPRDLPAMDPLIRQYDVALVILDPLLSRLDAALDTHKDAEVRQALEPLVSLAGATDSCVLGLIHCNKSSSSDALTLVMASRAFVAVARAVLFVMVDPEDDTRRLLGQPKNNLGRSDLPSLTFKIEGAHVADTPEGEVWTGKLEWTGETDRTIREAVEFAAESAGDRTASSEAADWLQDYLTEQGGCRDRATIEAAGKTAGHSHNAIARARQRLKLHVESRGFPRRTFWQLAPVVPLPGETGTSGTTGTTGASRTSRTSCTSGTGPRASGTTEGEDDYARL